MDLLGNALWMLGDYNTTIQAYCALLERKDLPDDVRQGIWETLHTYLTAERRRISGDKLYDLSGAELVSGIRHGLRHIYTGQYFHRLNADHLVMYAQVLSHYGSYGDAPLRRYARMVEQAHEEWAILKLEPVNEEVV